MRRGIGSAAVIKERERGKKLSEFGESLQTIRVSQARIHLESFKVKLSEFAMKYRSRIQQDASFREQFVSMCEKVGVDPIQSSRKGTSWIADLVGISSFYSDLSVQVLTQCMIHRKSEYGALLPMQRCVELIQGSGVSADDVRRAVRSLDCFGSGGVRLVNIGGETYVSSLPDELNSDSGTILSGYAAGETMTISEISKSVNWKKERIMHALNAMMQEGVVWEDNPGEGFEPSYWVLSIWLSRRRVYCK